MSKEFGHIYLSWRKGVGHPRHIVGVLKRNSTQGVYFKYLNQSNLLEASNDGFIPYTEFPELDDTYKKDVLSIFAQRLIKTERADIGDFLNFWEVNGKFINDKFYLLAHTQGLSPADNFEFLADFNPVKNLCFVSEIAGLSHLQLPPSTVVKGEELDYVLDPTHDNDKFAVRVFKGDQHIGYIKKIHSKVFYKRRANKLKIVVKDIDFNGIIKRIFVRISFS